MAVASSAWTGAVVNSIPVVWAVLTIGTGLLVAPRSRVPLPERGVVAASDSALNSIPNRRISIIPFELGQIVGEHLAQLVIGDEAARLPTRTTQLIGRTVLATAVLIPVSPLLATMVPVFVALRARRHRVERNRQRVTDIRGELSIVVDMLRVAASTGRSLPLAIATVCTPSASGELSQGLAAAVLGIERGQRLADGLTRFEDDPIIGPEVRPLMSALLTAERYGTPLPQVLGTLADDVRDLRRRHAETAARKAPVRMLAPLVLLLLPSFALLTVAPLLAGGLMSLRLASP
jgi:Flp pilus assembly protein TadB